ncbi:MAG: MarR family transcriptional regulator [Candidatus Promineifilaceae bacterium]|nr:MarR family transcriptional regulator [Candidatus Promineifilaceae bacterium]
MSTAGEYRHFAEDVALHFEQVGLSRTAGRIFGWLLISDPPHQTMDDVVEGLKVSKSSVSVATRFLIESGLVQRLSLPGERRDYYCVVEGVWQTFMRQQMNQVKAFRKLAEQGLKMLADQPAERRNRLREMRDFYAFFEEEIPALLDRWEMVKSEAEKD